jgi:hypothetical protein
VKIFIVLNALYGVKIKEAAILFKVCWGNGYVTARSYEAEGSKFTYREHITTFVPIFQQNKKSKSTK